MHDIKLIRENPEKFREGLKAKNASIDLDELLGLDEKRRKLLSEGEELKGERNKANQEIMRLKKEGDSAADTAIASMKDISQKIKEIDQNVGDINQKIAEIMLYIPNLAHNSVPVGKDESANKVIRTWGEPKKFDFEAKDQVVLGEKNELFSMEWGAKISGSGFPVYRGKGARLERALINFMLDFHSSNGYEEVWPPTIVNRTSMTGTSQLPKFEEDMYGLKDEDFFLIPTAEVPVTNLRRDELLKEKDLPLKYVAYTPCFRREAGSYGKDTKGLSRLHEFDKVELVKLVKPEESLAELELLVEDAEAILQALELPYRVVLLSSGDSSFAASKCYDLEVWAPGSKKWFEVSSCSVFGDFQARRMNIKYQNTENKREFVHTLNGSGVALARTFLCLIENCQQDDGSLKLPKVLEKYL